MYVFSIYTISAGSSKKNKSVSIYADGSMIFSLILIDTVYKMNLNQSVKLVLKANSPNPLPQDKMLALSQLKEKIQLFTEQNYSTVQFESICK